MSSTRSVISPGVWGADALTVVPPIPTPGASYRNIGAYDIKQGWNYSLKVDSAPFNEVMYRYSALINSMDQRGILGYTNLINYEVGAVVMGSDFLIYQCIVNNGPSSTPQDPISAPAYWRVLATPKAAAKAWCTFNGVTGTIITAYNVSNVSKTAAGVYTLTFPAGVFADANYAWAGSCSDQNGVSNVSGGGDNYLYGAQNAVGHPAYPAIRTTTQLRVITGLDNEDAQVISIIIFGN